MQVTINGKTETIDQPVSVAELLGRLELQPVRVAVEINRELVTRSEFNDTMLQEGDQIEIVTFVGGG